MRVVTSLGVGVLAVALASSAAAHPLSPALLELTEVGDGRVEVAWRTSDVDAVRRFELGDEGEEETAFERKARPLGWLRDGLPPIMSHTAERPQPVRYTIRWKLTGFEQPMVTYWEWTKTGWRIATWKLPKK